MNLTSGMSSMYLNPYMYMGANSLGLYSGVNSLGTGWTGVSGLNSFASILENALYSQSATCHCSCEGCKATSNMEKYNSEKTSGASKRYTAPLQNQSSYLEQYRSSLQKSLLQSGRITNQDVSRYRQRGFTRPALNSYKGIL